MWNMSKTCSSSTCAPIGRRQKSGPVLGFLPFPSFNHHTLQFHFPNISFFHIYSYCPSLSNLDYIQFFCYTEKNLQVPVTTLNFNPLSSLQEAKIIFVNCKPENPICLKPIPEDLHCSQTFLSLPPLIGLPAPLISYSGAKCFLLLWVSKCFLFF